jgi:hypothetical protein
LSGTHGSGATLKVNPDNTALDQGEFEEAHESAEVLVRIQAASVDAYGWHLLTADDSGVTRAGIRNSLEYIPYILTDLFISAVWIREMRSTAPDSGNAQMAIGESNYRKFPSGE